MTLLLVLALACNGRDPVVTDSADTDLPADTADTDGECVPTAVLEDCATEADDDCDGFADAVDALNCTDFYRDADGDGAGDPDDALCACVAPSGFVEGDGDCDDSTDAVGPSATESCNSIDDDCDGEIDPLSSEGCTVFYADTDGDGAGDADVEVCACEQPEAHVDNSEDCDDTTATVAPSAAESCNSIDDDCDGDVDPLDSEGCVEVFLDADGDGFGSSASVCACDLPDGYADSSDDCDDTSDAVSPAATEVCNSIDDDCDEAIDPTSSQGCEQVYRDFDGDGFGDATRTFCECDGRDGYVDDNTDCDDLDGAVNPDGTEVCNRIDDDCSGSADEDAVDKQGFFLDGDGDGYAADGADRVVACEAPDGYGAGTGDCDDADPLRSPGLAERCDDGDIDNDCDDSTDAAGVITVYDGSGDWVGDVGTLSDAVSLADEGAELLFCEGTYEGGLNLGFSGFDLTLRGLRGSEATELTAPDGESVILHRVGSLVLEGLTLSGADLPGGRGGGVNAQMSGADALVLRDVELRDHRADYGAGLNTSGGTVTLDNVRFEDNQVVQAGGGAMFTNSEVSFSGLSFINNTSRSYGGFWLDGGEMRGTDLELRGNTASILSGGGYAGGDAELEVDGFTFIDNSGDAGGALLISNTASAVLSNGEVLDNLSQGVGGGLYVLRGSLDVSNTRFERNSATAGGGIYRSNLSIAELSFTNCSFGGSGTNDNTPDDVTVGITAYELPDGASGDCPDQQDCALQ